MPGAEIDSKPHRLAMLFMTWLVIILAMKWPALLEPPVWDAAFGLFPAAGELSDSGFDLLRLLHLPTYHLGGPNCHAESIVTWLTAIVLASLGKGPFAFFVLHLLHFSAAAWTLAVLHKFLACNVGRAEAWGIGFATLLCPIFSVQTSAMYFEIPLAACAISAMVAYCDGQIKSALVWSVLAVMVKQVGIVVPAVLIAAILLQTGPLLRRVMLAAAFVVPALLAAAIPLVGTPLLKAASSAAAPMSWWMFMNVHHMPYLKAVPDLVTAMGVLIIAGTLLIGTVWWALRRPFPTAEGVRTVGAANQSQDQSARNWLLFSLGYLQLLAFAGFFFVVPYLCRLDFYCLPRYFVFLVPLLIFGLVLAGRSFVSRRVTMTGLLLACSWFVVNQQGTWYPAAQPNNGAIAERAAGCFRLAGVQRAATLATSRVPPQSLLLYGLPEHYFLQYPWMGYANQPHPGGRCVTLAHERPASLEINDLPDRFYVLVDAVILGGRELRKIVRDAKADPGRDVRIIGNFVSEPYRVSLYEISRIPQALASASPVSVQVPISPAASPGDRSDQ